MTIIQKQPAKYMSFCYSLTLRYKFSFVFFQARDRAATEWPQIILAQSATT